MKPEDWPDYPNPVEAAQLAWDASLTRGKDSTPAEMCIGIYPQRPTWQATLAKELCQLWGCFPRFTHSPPRHPDTGRLLRPTYRIHTLGPLADLSAMHRVYNRLMRDVKRWDSDHGGALGRGALVAALAGRWATFRALEASS